MPKGRAVKVLFVTKGPDGRECRTVFESCYRNEVAVIAVVASEVLATAKGLYLPHAMLHIGTFEYEGVIPDDAKILHSWWSFLKRECYEELVLHDMERRVYEDVVIAPHLGDPPIPVEVQNELEKT